MLIHPAWDRWCHFYPGVSRSGRKHARSRNQLQRLLCGSSSLCCRCLTLFYFCLEQPGLGRTKWLSFTTLRILSLRHRREAFFGMLHVLSQHAYIPRNAQANTGAIKIGSNWGSDVTFGGLTFDNNGDASAGMGNVAVSWYGSECVSCSDDESNSAWGRYRNGEDSWTFSDVRLVRPWAGWLHCFRSQFDWQHADPPGSGAGRRGSIDSANRWAARLHCARRPVHGVRCRPLRRDARRIRRWEGCARRQRGLPDCCGR